MLGGGTDSISERKGTAGFPYVVRSVLFSRTEWELPTCLGPLGFSPGVHKQSAVSREKWGEGRENEGGMGHSRR